jgi:hypothetical protein
MFVKINTLTGFPSFFSKVKSQKLPFKTSYRLTLLAQEIEKHINFYQSEFNNLLMEYGKKDSNGNLIPTQDKQGIILLEEKKEEAYAQLNELQLLEAELPEVWFSVDEFDGIELSPEEMIAIMPFIKE